MSKIKATWTVTLDCECPGCHEDVNLLDEVDFWDGNDLEIGENNTDKSRDVKVFCPLCSHEFKVDYEW